MESRKDKTNIKLAILNMFQYVMIRAILQPVNRTGDDITNKTVKEMLAAIIS